MKTFDICGFLLISSWLNYKCWEEFSLIFIVAVLSFLPKGQFYVSVNWLFLSYIILGGYIAYG